MEADAPADTPTPDHHELARAVALLERVSSESIEDARRARRAQAEGSVDLIVESARERAARILRAVGPSVDRVTGAEVPATEAAFGDFTRELIRVRESVDASRDAVVDALDAAGSQVVGPTDVLPPVAFPADLVPPAPPDQPVSATAAYFAALRAVPVPEPDATAIATEPETPSVPVAAATVAGADAPAKPRYEIPWFLVPPTPHPEAAAPEATAPDTAEPEATETAEPDVAEPVEAAAESSGVVPAAPEKPRSEIPWFLNPPPPRPTAATARTAEAAPAVAEPSGDLLPSAKAAAPRAPEAAPDVTDVADVLPTPVAAVAGPATAPAPAVAPAELMPAAKAGSKLRVRRLLARVFRDTGILLIAFAVLQLWGTGLLQSRSQHALRSDFAQAVATAHAQRARAAAHAVSDRKTAVAPVAATTPATGDPVARIRIPAIGVDQIVVEGTGVAELRRGPGHDESTPLPGHTGDSVVTGHRTTYGAPFDHLDDLKVGDRISVTTTEGSSTYVVSDGPKSVSGGVVAPVTGAGTDHLILTTSQPRYRASEQLAVVARLRGRPGAPVAAIAQRSGAAAIGGFGWFASSLWASVLLWGALLLIVYVAMYRLATRWRGARVAIFTLMAVPLVITAFAFLQAIGRVFPANY